MKKFRANSFVGYCAVRISGAFLVLAPTILYAQVHVSEVAYDPLHADAKHEWIELHNTGNEAVDLSKWTFSAGSSAAKHVLNPPPKNGGIGSLLLAPGAYVVVADDAATLLAEYPGLSSVIDSTMSLPNPTSGSSATVVLYDGEKHVADTFAYTGAVAQKNTGDSAQRAGAIIIGAAPTPGTANATVPRPPKAAAAPAPQTTKPTPPRQRDSGHNAGTVPSEPVMDSSDEVVAPSADEVATSSHYAAAAATVVPSSSVWVWASAALALCGAGAAAYAASLKKDEWEIEDMSPSV